jgi:predicted DNA-binding transcriptional regulator YafY
VSLIGTAQAAMDLGLGADATAARLKILASLPLGSGKLAERIAARFHLDPAPWYSHPEPPPALRPLAEAVWSDRRVRMTYESWKNVVTRTVSPLGLVMKAGSWYVAGAVESSVRIYRVDAIREFKLTDEPAERPRNFDLARFWTDAARSFEGRLRGEKARVRLSPAGVKLLRDVNPGAAAAIDAQHPQPTDDAWIEAQIFVERLPHAVREALRMGAEMEVLEPAELRKAIAEEARRVARIHTRKRSRRK